MGKNGEIAKAYLSGNDDLRDALGITHNAALTPHALGTGEHNLNYWFADPACDRKYVLRINVTKQPFHTNQVRYEYDALKTLEPSGCTPLPLYIDDSPNAPGEGVLVISFCEGAELDFDDLHPDDLETVARLMADVHSVRTGEDCTLFRPADPLCTLFEECAQRYRLYLDSAAAEPRVARWMDRFVAECGKAVDGYAFDASDSHIVNTEPLASHFLIPRDADGRALHGSFIDWERPILGDVAEDVAFFTAPTTTFWDSGLLLSADEAAAFVEAYWSAVDGRIARAGFHRRYAAFRKMVALRAFTWCCRYQVQMRQNPSMHHAGQAAQKVPAYLSDDFLEYAARECFGL